MEQAAEAFARDIAGTGLARWASDGAVYPVANVLHLLGLVLLLGGIGLVDLRIAGQFPQLPVAALSRALTPVALAGFVILLLSGATLFAADAVATCNSMTFRWKLMAVAVALLNALAFRMLFKGLERGGSIRVAARLMAVASLVSWLTVATLGRMIAYS